MPDEVLVELEQIEGRLLVLVMTRRPEGYDPGPVTASATNVPAFGVPQWYRHVCAAYWSVRFARRDRAKGGGPSAG